MTLEEMQKLAAAYWPRWKKYGNLRSAVMSVSAKSGNFHKLIDKNRKQIFTGDMVEWYQSKEDSVPVEGTVLFGKFKLLQLDCFGFYVEPTGDYEGDDELRAEITGALIRGEVEVIGNVFTDY